MVKNPPAIPGLGRSPGGGHGNPLQYSCLENPMDRGAWRAAVHRVTKSRTGLSGHSMQCCVSIATVYPKISSSLWQNTPYTLGSRSPLSPSPNLAQALAMQSTLCLCGCPLWKLLIRGVKMQKSVKEGSLHMGPCRGRSPSRQPCVTSGKTGV